jgi:hypothetical protein
MAILTAPTLLDFWITCCTVSTPCGSASWMVEPVMVIEPGVGVDDRLRRDEALLQPMPTTKGFIVEPGSKTSVSARLRSCRP